MLKPIHCILFSYTDNLKHLILLRYLYFMIDLVFHPEDQGGRFLQKAGTFPSNYATSHHRKNNFFSCVVYFYRVVIDYNSSWYCFLSVSQEIQQRNKVIQL
jgi:hypothetical protein